MCERLYTLTPTCRPAPERVGRGESKQGRGLRGLSRARGVLRGAQAVGFKRRISALSEVPSALCPRSVSGQLSPRPSCKTLPPHLPPARAPSILRRVHAGSELINSQLGSAVAPPCLAYFTTTADCKRHMDVCWTRVWLKGTSRGPQDSEVIEGLTV